MVRYVWQCLGVSILLMAAGVCRRLCGSDRRKGDAVNAKHAAIVVHVVQISRQRRFSWLMRLKFVDVFGLAANKHVARID